MNQSWTMSLRLIPGRQKSGAIIGRVRARDVAREQRCRPGGAGELRDVTRALVECARRQPATGVLLMDLHDAVRQSVSAQACRLIPAALQRGPLVWSRVRRGDQVLRVYRPAA